MNVQKTPQRWIIPLQMSPNSDEASSPMKNATVTVEAPSDASTANIEDDESVLLLSQFETSSSPSNDDSGLSFLKSKFQEFLGMEPTADIIAIITIYFVEGALGLASLAKTYLLKDELNLGPAEMSALMGIFVLPWTIKPLYGFLSDGFPLFGYRRKSYLVAAGLIGASSYALLSFEPLWNAMEKTTAISGTVVALLLSSACIALSDVVADGIVVTKTRKADEEARAMAAAQSENKHDGSVESSSVAGGLQSLCWGSSAVGSLLSAYFSGSLLQVLPVRSIFGITAVMPLLVAGIALQMDEEPLMRDPQAAENDKNAVIEKIKDQTSKLWEAFQEPSIWKPTLFLFLWQSTPTADGAFFYFLTNDLNFGPEFMGRVRLLTSVATLVGVWLYNGFFKTVAIKDILFWSALASFPLGMIPVLLTTHANQALGIPDQALIYGDDVVLAMLGEIAFLPCLVLAARICPPGVEAVLFATLMSIFNGASTVGTEIGAALTKAFGITDSDFTNLTLLLVLCNVTSLYPLAFLGFLDKVGDMSENDLQSMDQESLATKAKE